ncbi:hypothetical protein GIB67_033572 [Kingdonia uniflora]|uniref:N-acetyltransferase domain-containing protein n=1 Tax=Kingdonia uniflora TaxID=39325 RepID=A0A7J7L6I0_9MAGN|nr:hypothetical protein GIB67_033572 [Kingdonia uniflora]
MQASATQDDSLPDISLRCLNIDDIDDFMVWATDDHVSHFCRWDTYTSKDDALNYIKNVVIPHPWFMAICLGNKPFGAISVTPFHGEDRCRAELGYVLASKHWGRGIATRAVKMVVGMIFEEWSHLERLEALVHVENVGSQKVLEKAGFVKEGVLRKYVIQKGKARDMVIYSFLSTDPPKFD